MTRAWGRALAGPGTWSLKVGAKRAARYCHATNTSWTLITAEREHASPDRSRPGPGDALFRAFCAPRMVSDRAEQARLELAYGRNL